MTRLDIELVNRQICETRSKAQMEIKSSNVLVNNKAITKSSFDVKQQDTITLKSEGLKYVSRGGLKLEKAINEFNINLNNKIMLDIGSSTGGFTDCALQNGIKQSICIDVGSNQLDEKIRINPKVKVFENTDIRKFENDLLNKIDLITIDISFISVTKIMPKLKEINAKEIICLIKPQFECGKEVADKYKGIILNKEVHGEVIKNVINEFKKINYYLNQITSSPITGGNGNIEYLVYLTSENKNSKINIKDLVEKTFKKIKSKE